MGEVEVDEDDDELEPVEPVHVTAFRGTKGLSTKKPV
jgi:hypothetical protein